MRVFVTNGCALLIAALVATGCTVVTPSPVPPEIVMEMAPEGLILPCAVSLPPDRQAYLTADFAGKEEVLTKYATKLILNLNVCNARIDSYLSWRRKQEVLFKTTTGESDASQHNTK
jgi:hypothetical protein